MKSSKDKGSIRLSRTLALCTLWLNTRRACSRQTKRTARSVLSCSRKRAQRHRMNCLDKTITSWECYVGTRSTRIALKDGLIWLVLCASTINHRRPIRFATRMDARAVTRFGCACCAVSEGVSPNRPIRSRHSSTPSKWVATRTNTSQIHSTSTAKTWKRSKSGTFLRRTSSIGCSRTWLTANWSRAIHPSLTVWTTHRFLSTTN